MGTTSVQASSRPVSTIPVRTESRESNQTGFKYECHLDRIAAESPLKDISCRAFWVGVLRASMSARPPTATLVEQNDETQKKRSMSYSKIFTAPEM